MQDKLLLCKMALNQLTDNFWYDINSTIDDLLEQSDKMIDFTFCKKYCINIQ